jgi:hypothetical protein
MTSAGITTSCTPARRAPVPRTTHMHPFTRYAFDLPSPRCLLKRRGTLQQLRANPDHTFISKSWHYFYMLIRYIPIQVHPLRSNITTPLNSLPIAIKITLATILYETSIGKYHITLPFGTSDGHISPVQAEPLAILNRAAQSNYTRSLSEFCRYALRSRTVPESGRDEAHQCSASPSSDVLPTFIAISATAPCVRSSVFDANSAHRVVKQACWSFLCSRLASNPALRCFPTLSPHLQQHRRAEL